MKVGGWRVRVAEAAYEQAIEASGLSGMCGCTTRGTRMCERMGCTVEAVSGQALEYAGRGQVLGLKGATWAGWTLAVGGAQALTPSDGCCEVST